MPTRPKPAPPTEWTKEYLRDLNELLANPPAGAMGGYCLGVVTVLMRQHAGRLPDRALMERAAKCTRISDALALAMEALDAAL